MKQATKIKSFLTGGYIKRISWWLGGKQKNMKNVLSLLVTLAVTEPYSDSESKL